MNVVFIMVFYTELNFFNYLSYFDFRYHELHSKSTTEIENIKSKITTVLRKNKVSKAGIFGSYSRGEQNKNSDIDIAVEINDENMSLLGFIRLIRLLEELLKRKVDLIEYQAIKPRIRENILRSQVSLL